MENENASGNVNMSNLLANLSVVLTYLAKKSGDQNNKNAVSKDGTTGDDHNAMGARTMIPPPSIVGAIYVNAINIIFNEMVLFAVSMKTLAYLAIRSRTNSSNLTNDHIAGEEKKEGANLLNRLDLLSVVKNLKENEKIAKIASLIIKLIKENGYHVLKNSDNKNNRNAVFRGKEEKKEEKEKDANLLHHLNLRDVIRKLNEKNDLNQPCQMVETLTQFTSHENSSDDEQRIKVK